MERNTIIYWISTSLLALQLVLASFMYFTAADMKANFEHLGFPAYFRIELGIAKLLAAAVLILPMVPQRLKEWAYVGVAIVFISAFVAHASVDGASTGIAPLVSLVILAVSYVFARKRSVALA